MGNSVVLWVSWLVWEKSRRTEVDWVGEGRMSEEEVALGGFRCCMCGVCVFACVCL